MRFSGRRLGGNFGRTHMEERTSFYDGKAGRWSELLVFRIGVIEEFWK